MSAVVHARVVEQLTRLRLRYVADRLDAVLNDAARTEPTYLDFLDSVLRQEVDAKQRTRVAMGLKIAHFPTVKTLDEFDFKFQPSIDQRRHGTTREAPLIRFERDERVQLRPLADRALPRRVQRVCRRVALDAFVDVDTVRYSVPHRLVRDLVEVAVGDDRVEIFHGTELVATHARSTEPFARVVNPQHYAGLWRVDTAAAPIPSVAGLGRDLADYAAIVTGGGQ